MLYDISDALPAVDLEFFLLVVYTWCDTQANIRSSRRHGDGQASASAAGGGGGGGGGGYPGLAVGGGEAEVAAPVGDDDDCCIVSTNYYINTEFTCVLLLCSNFLVKTLCS